MPDNAVWYFYLESDFDDVQWAYKDAGHHASCGSSQSCLFRAEHDIAVLWVIANHPLSGSHRISALGDIKNDSSKHNMQPLQTVTIKLYLR